MRIRLADAADAPAIAAVILPVIRAGATYALDPAMEPEAALAYWLGADRETFVAEDGDGAILGTYYLRANQAGNGAHVSNCGFMTAAAATGRGVARAMAEHAIDHARARGFRAMQFNFVVSTNARGAAVGIARLRGGRPPARRVPSPARRLCRRAGDVSDALSARLSNQTRMMS